MPPQALGNGDQSSNQNNSDHYLAQEQCATLQFFAQFLRSYHVDDTLNGNFYQHQATP